MRKRNRFCQSLGARGFHVSCRDCLQPSRQGWQAELAVGCRVGSLSNRRVDRLNRSVKAGLVGGGKADSHREGAVPC